MSSNGLSVRQTRHTRLSFSKPFTTGTPLIRSGRQTSRPVGVRNGRLRAINVRSEKVNTLLWYA